MSLTLFMKYGLKVNLHRRDLTAVAATIRKECVPALHSKDSIAAKCNGNGNDVNDSGVGVALSITV
ncbi:hypothetical protein BVC80_1787g71 [Macleaya cordata]|uniref:Uncharacterized protein n=1 Tax=Macleaya cordata TaxID=56857 RepID=A0A200QU56_MACCD|nr:hypothetical protein BVC80_1787g71 [Macleaya cordata]